MDHEREDPDRLTNRIIAVVADLGSPIGGELQCGEFEPTVPICADLGSHVGKHFTCGSRVSADAVDAVLANFDAGSRQLDETAEEPADGAFGTRNPPEPLPLFVGFPIEARVKVVQGK